MCGRTDASADDRDVQNCIPEAVYGEAKTRVELQPVIRAHARASSSVVLSAMSRMNFGPT